LGQEIAARSPLDDSPHWGPAPQGEPIPGAPADQRRRTSYGMNNWLSRSVPADINSVTYDRLIKIPRPSSTIQFMIMAYEGNFAGADHPHVEGWAHFKLPGLSPVFASSQVQINAVSGETRTWEAQSNWGYLDGHARTLDFRSVYQTAVENQFDPNHAR
ncbi:MAG: hypothetical protein AAF710_12565, partial [Planctomycetota bacterium]